MTAKPKKVNNDLLSQFIRLYERASETELSFPL